MEAVAKGTLLCGHIRALVTRFKRGAPHLRFMRTHSFPLVQGGYALTEAAESVCRGKISSEIPIKGSKQFPAPASGV